MGIAIGRTADNLVVEWGGAKFEVVTSVNKITHLGWVCANE